MNTIHTIERRISTLEALQPSKEPEEVFIEVADEARAKYEKCFLACQKVNGSEDKPNALFYRILGNALALVNTQRIESDRPGAQRREDVQNMHIIDLEVMKCVERLVSLEWRSKPHS